MGFNINLKGDVKIPTILGLGILIIGISLGVFLTSQNQIFSSKASASLEPNNINIANISDNSASIYWETSSETTGFIKSGIAQNNLDKTYLDDRDQKTPQNHRLHFVTMQNLSPETTYYYQIQSGQSLYPKESLSFKTSATINTFSFEPIAGNITTKDFEPVSEAIITLSLPNAQKIATITLVAGNFIFPLTNFKTADLISPYPQSKSPLKAKLFVKGVNGNSEVDFKFPLLGSALPTIILGKYSDFTLSNISSSSAGLKTSIPSGQNINYDLNSDGVINTADISLLFKNFGKINNNNIKLDLNSDGVINQDDVYLLMIF